MKTTYENLSREQVKAYFNRLGITVEGDGFPEPSLELLNQLIEAHQKKIPFEDLEVYLQRLPLSLEVQDLYEKIIVRKRGGYCFELNGLFISLLRSLGFDAWSCFCRVIRGRDMIRPVSHRGNIIKIEGQLYFCDVGFGGPMSCHAVLLESELHQKIGEEEFWPVEEENGWWSLMRYKKGSQDDYDAEKETGEQMELMFQSAQADPVDFIPLNLFLTDNPESLFRSTFIANIRTDHGYRNIQNMVFTVKENGVVTRREMADEEERADVLKTYFDIVL